MAYVDPDYKSKKDFKAAVATGAKHYAYNPSGLTPEGRVRKGRITIEGPHYPKPHRWYADCDVVDGVVVKVR